MILVESMKKMGYEPKEVEESLKQGKYDDITATYLLLGRKPLNEVNNKCLLTVRSCTVHQRWVEPAKVPTSVHRTYVCT